MLEQLGKQAKEASVILANAGITEKNEALKMVAKCLVDSQNYILTENLKDLEKARANGMKESLIDRLTLTIDRIEGMAEGILQVADLDDPLREQPVENADLERWNIQKEELYQYAVKNTPELFPAQVKTAEKAEEGNDREPVFIVSSRQGIYGASVLLYPGFLEDFSGRYPWNFFFMPLTLHEVFILLDRGQYMPDQLHEIAQTYTSEIISKKDRLSDNIYYYDSEEYQILTLY